MGDLKADLESAKRAREALESEVARLRDDLKHADEKQKELERCITEGQDNAAAIGFRNESLTRQLEEGRWEMGAANMEVARLRADNDTLNRQFLDAQKHSIDASPAIASGTSWTIAISTALLRSFSSVFGPPVSSGRKKGKFTLRW